MKQYISLASLLYAILLVIHYNCEDGYIDFLIDELRNSGGHYHAPSNNFLYQLLVILYGEYDTSPRSGWIDNTEDAIKLLYKIKEA